MAKKKTLGIDERDLDEKILRALREELVIVGKEDGCDNPIIGNEFGAACKIRSIIHEVVGTEPLYKKSR